MTTAVLQNLQRTAPRDQERESAAADTPAPQVEPPQHFVFYNVSWQEFEAFCAALPERHFRLAYDGNRLEIMSIRELHGRLRRLLARVIDILTEELNLPMRSSGDFTMKRADIERGIESDECFYLENEARVRGKKEIDLAVDPPPDLGTEIEVTTTVLDRLAIYAALRVPEVWRYSGGREIIVLHLHADGEYRPAERSKYFLQVPLNDVAEFLERHAQMDETTLFRALRTWVREQIARNWQKPA